MMTRRLSLLERQMPHAQIVGQNPVFDYELRRVGWPRSRQDLKRYSIVALLSMHGLIALLWLAERLVYSLGGYPLHPTTFLYTLIAIATLGLAILSDLYYAVATVGNITRQIESGEWDLLRVTALHSNSILTAEYAVAQLRSWPVMSLEVALRTAGGVFVVALNMDTVFILAVTLAVSWPVIIVVAMYLA